MTVSLGLILSMDANGAEMCGASRGWQVVVCDASKYGWDIVIAAQFRHLILSASYLKVSREGL